MLMNVNTDSAKLPIKFTISVPAGMPCTGRILDKEYRKTEPMAPPSPTSIRISVTSLLTF
jgi:hypothetical protein